MSHGDFLKLWSDLPREAGQIKRFVCCLSNKCSVLSSINDIDVEKCSESMLKDVSRSFLFPIPLMSVIKADLTPPPPDCVLYVDWLRDSIWSLYFVDVFEAPLEWRECYCSWHGSTQWSGSGENQLMESILESVHDMTFGRWGDSKWKTASKSKDKNRVQLRLC